MKNTMVVRGHTCCYSATFKVNDKKVSFHLGEDTLKMMSKEKYNDSLVNMIEQLQKDNDVPKGKIGFETVHSNVYIMWIVA